MDRLASRRGGLRFSRKRTDEPFASLRDQFRQLLEESVKAQLHHGRVGCFLSGGTDSSTVAGMLGRVTGDRPCDLFDRLRRRGLRSRWSTRALPRSTSIPTITSTTSRPTTWCGVFHRLRQFMTSPSEFVGRSRVLLRADGHAGGHSALLAGDGGDELFGGNTRYAKERYFPLTRNFRRIESPCSNRPFWVGHCPAKFQG